jgi:hypothetical protein
MSAVTRPNSKTAIALCVLGALLLACGGVLAYVRAEIVSSKEFSGRLVSALDHGSVRSAASRQVAAAVINEQRPDLLAIRPLITGAVDAVVRSPSFKRIALPGVEAAHRAFVRGDRSVPIRIADGGQNVVDAVRSVSPRAAELISPHVDPVVARLRNSDPQLKEARRLVDASSLWWLVLGLGVLAVAGAGVLRGGRLGIAYAGAAVSVAGAIVALLVTVGGAVVASKLANVAGGERAAIDDVWSSLFGDLRWAGVACAAGGIAAWVLAVGSSGRRIAARAAAGAAVVAITGAAVAAVAVSLAAPSPPGPVPGGCNGLPRLCDERLNDVVFPATHNSYAAAAEPGWLFANQRYAISRQLDDGIRGLLLDIHFGVRDEKTGRVRTDLRAEGSDRNKVAKALSPEALRVADRVAGRVGAGELGGKPELYLCHTLCELGAEPLVQELKVIQRFLKSHRDEVLTVIVEDYVPPKAIESAFDQAGLLPYVAQLKRDAPLPTLRDLIDTGKRLVVFAEVKGGAPPWYMPAFSFIQDTPYDASRSAQLDCTRNRGDADNPMLLLNHWIARFPPRVSDQVRVGGRFLHNRIERCTTKGGIPGAIVAVDFYERTGVVDVSRALNARDG